MATDRVRDTIVVETDPATVLSVLSDIGTYPQWLEEFKEAEVLATDEQGRLAAAHFRVAALGISISFRLDYTWGEGRMAWELVEGDMLQQLDGAYIASDDGSGGTLLTYELEVRSTIPLPNLVRRRIAKKIIDDSLRGAKARAEARAAGGER